MTLLTIKGFTIGSLGFLKHVERLSQNSGTPHQMCHPFIPSNKCLYVMSTPLITSVTVKNEVNFTHCNFPDVKIFI